MKIRTTMIHQLEEAGLVPADTIRLVLEMIESLQGRCCGKSRLETLRLLRRVIQEGVHALERSEYTVTFEYAATRSLASRVNLRPAYRSDLRHFIRRMLRVPNMAERPLRSMTSQDCRQLLQKAFAGSLSSFVKGRVILSSIFSFGLRQEWCDVNPVRCIDVPRQAERAIRPLTLEEVERLKRTACTSPFRDMKLSLALMLYGGIRPAEVARLRPDDFCWQEGQVIIRPRVSKTGGGRMVPLRGIRGIQREERFIPRNWMNRWRRLRRAAGFERWISDSCRHTFASYHAAYFRNLPELQLEMGHRDSDLLRSRYVVPTYRSIAATFWKSAHFSA